MVCSKHFSVSHGKIDNVRRHGEGKKHLELFNARKSTNQVTKYYVSSNSSSLDENVIKAETLISPGCNGKTQCATGFCGPPGKGSESGLS